MGDFPQLHQSPFEKLTVLWNKQSSNSLNCDIIVTLINYSFCDRKHIVTGSWISEFDAVNCMLTKNPMFEKAIE